MKLKALSIAAAGVLFCGYVNADTASFAFDTGDVITIKNFNNTSVLSGGSDATGDGTVIEFGYYSSASISNKFSGNWVSIAGGNSLNTAFAGNSIGDIVDDGAGDGTYANTLIFDTTLSNSVVTLPSGGQILAVRFYNATTVAASTHFAAASNDIWTWLAPASTQSIMTYSLSNEGVVWQGNFVGYTGNALTAAIPEPATFTFFLGLASIGFCVGRRRRRG